MNWTKLRDTYLFAITSNVALGLVLYLVRKDFTWHGAVILWLLLTLVFESCRKIQKNVFLKIGHFNSSLLLSVFYFFIFTPFSLFYKGFKRHESFLPASSRWIEKSDKCDFDRPF